MIDRARAVVIGGGIGGCSVLYWLTRLGWADVVARRARRADQRVDLPLGRARRPAALVARADPDDDGLGRALPDARRRGRPRDRLARGRVAAPGVVAPSTSRSSSARPPGPRPSGCRCELIGADEAQALFPPMSTEGVLGAAYLPTDGYVDPSQLTFALAKGARQRGATILTSTRVTGMRVERGRVVGVDTDAGRDRVRGRRQRRRHLRPRDRRARRRARARSWPMAHQYAITKPAGLPRDMPTLRDPARLVYFRGESGGLVAGGYERNPAVWALDGHPGRLQLAAPRPGLGALRPALRGGRPPGADARGRRDRHPGQRARGLHPRRRVHPGRERGARLLGRGRLLRPRDRRLGRHGQDRRRVDRRGQPALDAWALDSRRFGPAYRGPRLHARAHRARSTPPTTTSSTPATSAPAAGRCAPRALYGRHQALGAAFGEKSGWERVNWYESERGRRRRGRAPGRLGRRALVARRSGPSTAPAARRRALRRELLRQDRGRRRRRGRVPRAALRQPGRSRGRGDHLHPAAQRPRRHRVRLHGDAPGRGPVPHRDRHGVRQPRRSPGCARTSTTAPACASRTSPPPVRVPGPVGAGGARRPRRRSPRPTWATPRSAT